jgi:hypothetical protein
VGKEEVGPAGRTEVSDLDVGRAQSGATKLGFGNSDEVEVRCRRWARQVARGLPREEKLRMPRSE